MSEISAFKLLPSVEGPHDIGVVVGARNPGEADSIWPTLSHLANNPDLSTTVLAADCAYDSLVNVKDISLIPFDEPGGVVIDRLAASGDVVAYMTGVSSKTDMHTKIARALPGAKRVFVEDYYGSAELDFERSIREGLPLPDHIVTLDEFARQELVKKYGHVITDIASKIEVTGQPALDYLIDRDSTDTLRKEARSALGLSNADTLIACFSSVDTLELVDDFAEALAKNKEDISVVFNPHPRDLTSLLEYQNAFRRRGIRLHNTENWTYRQLLAASDIATILPHSTLSLHAIKLGKPTLHVTNDKNGAAGEQVPVRRGASPLVFPSEFWDVTYPLLDVVSPERAELLDTMDRLYRAKGGSAARVAASMGRMAGALVVERAA